MHFFFTQKRNKRTYFYSWKVFNIWTKWWWRRRCIKLINARIGLFSDPKNWYFIQILDSEVVEVPTIKRYRPENLQALCKLTKFSEYEMKRIYRGFKADCPTGIIREEQFKTIYSQFFPQGCKYCFNGLKMTSFSIEVSRRSNLGP